MDIIGFAIPEPISVDGKALKIYIHPYPTGFDYNEDILQDLLIGIHNAEILIFENIGKPDSPKPRGGGVLQDENGKKIKSFSFIRAYLTDADGDGMDELIASSYYGNQNRHLVYKRRGKGWKNKDSLEIRATKNTPVCGMGNSAIELVDWGQ